MKETNYSYLLTNEDKVKIAFRKRYGKIEYFVVQYSALINSRWRSIMRFDSYHGYAHKHTFHMRKKEHIIKLTSAEEDLNEVFTESSKFIRNNFKKIKENYIKT